MSNEENVTLQNAEDSADKEQQKEQTPDMQEPQTDKPVEGMQSDTSADISDDSAKSDDVGNRRCVRVQPRALRRRLL